MSGSYSSEMSRSDRALLQAFEAEEEAQEAAWKEFLRRHSQLILKIAHSFVSEQDAAMELYLHACERLAANNFAKLRTYDPTRGKTPAKVSTWLAVVVRNLCIERHRRSEGRKRYPEAVADLSSLDQKVFELYFWEGYSQREIVRNFETEPDYDGEAVPAAMSRLRDLELSPSKSWARQPSEEVELLGEALHEAEVSSEGGRSEADRREWIEMLLEDLPPKQRLAVRWYYWTGVSASGIARLLQVSQRKVYSLLDRALETLREEVGTQVVEP